MLSSSKNIRPLALLSRHGKRELKITFSISLPGFILVTPIDKRSGLGQAKII
jgi:hypothetical protein